MNIDQGFDAVKSSCINIVSNIMNNTNEFDDIQKVTVRPSHDNRERLKSPLFKITHF